MTPSGLRRRTGYVAVVASLVVLAPLAAHAHARSTSTSSFEIDPGHPPRAQIRVRAPLADLQRAIARPGEIVSSLVEPGSATLALIDRYLQEHVLLRSGGEACAVVGPASPITTTDPTHIGRAWQVLCEASGPLSIESTAFFDVQPAHLHLARVHVAGLPPVEQVLVRSKPRAPVDVPGAVRPVGSDLLDYVRLGVEHIFSGADHLCFVLALLLIGTTLGEVATVVTGFTAAHSVTLALGVLGLVRPTSTAVEALIGLSIVVLALENFVETTQRRTRHAVMVGLALLLVAAMAGSLGGRFAVPALALLGIGLFSLCYFALLSYPARPARLRWVIAFVFGLVHGFGFAGVLAETGLSSGRLAQALLGFNLGVELGQLAIVAALWPPYRLLLSRSPAMRPVAVQVGSAAVLAAGLFWFLARAMGGA